MIENAKDILNRARENAYAVPQFNINNLEWAKYILEICEDNKSPVILGVSESAAKYMGGFKTVYSLVYGLVSDLNITIPVVLHLDHAKSFDSCKSAIDAGFTSVMIDASSYSLEKNIMITKEVVDYAHPKGVTVEAEIGHVGGVEDNIVADVVYAKLEDCIRLVNETNIDSLAPALGSAHGFYKGAAKIDLDRLKNIKDNVSVPLVLHGGTGIDNITISKCIENGVSKVNINTELQVTWAQAVRKFLNNDASIYDPRKIIGSGAEFLKASALEKILLFKSNNKA
jgi:fructose-1,6-bisphosphate aldolase class II